MERRDGDTTVPPALTLGRGSMLAERTAGRRPELHVRGLERRQCLGFL